ncbi:hypothetical protein ABLE68_00145 [Nocardioides sp. CN2-186]|uniref:hypothetical protein n=1 Tax=Nocardioides tweenelious TaxID=3156607 RepID=UPI0032B39324
MSRWRVIVGVATAATLLAGCGEAQTSPEDDLCVRYDLLTHQVSVLADLDPTVADADDLSDSAEQVEDQLDALQAVAEGQLDARISALRTSLGDLVDAADAAGHGALEATRPLLEDTVDDVNEAWAALEQVADVKCAEA